MTTAPDYNSLSSLKSHAWDALDPAVRTVGPETRLASLATIAPGGAPALRQLVIRAADRVAGTVDLYTDARSHKVAQIAANPATALLLWCPDAALQVRATGRAAVITGDAAQAEWAKTAPAQRGNYGTTPAPGAPIPGPGAFTREAKQGRFAILRLSVQALDLVVLCEPQHRRAQFSADDGWAGAWVAP